MTASAPLNTDFPSQRSAAPVAAAPSDWISHSLRHLERWVAWSIAVYTAWLAVFALPGVPGIWLLVLYAGLVGKWAEARPARHQSDMTLRGLALIVRVRAWCRYADMHDQVPVRNAFGHP